MMKKPYKLHRSARGKVGKRRALSRRVPKYKNGLPWVIKFTFVEKYDRAFVAMIRLWATSLLDADERTIFGPPPQMVGPNRPVKVTAMEAEIA